MTDVEATLEDFIASRRSGRRNAVHDIPAGPGEQGASDLSERLAQLNVNKPDEGGDAEKSQDSPDKEEECQGEGD